MWNNAVWPDPRAPSCAAEVLPAYRSSVQNLDSRRTVTDNRDTLACMVALWLLFPKAWIMLSSKNWCRKKEIHTWQRRNHENSLVILIKLVFPKENFVFVSFYSGCPIRIAVSISQLNAVNVKSFLSLSCLFKSVVCNGSLLMPSSYFYHNLPVMMNEWKLFPLIIQNIFI